MDRPLVPTQGDEAQLARALAQLKALRDLKARQGAARRQAGTADAIHSRLAETVRLRTGLQMGDLDHLWREDPDRVYFIALLALMLGNEQQTLLNHKALAARFLEFLSEAVQVRTVALATYEAAKLAPVICRRGAEDVPQTEEITRLMLEAARSGSVAVREEASQRSADPARTRPSIAIPVTVGDHVVAALFIDRLEGTESFAGDLPYLRTIAQLGGWPIAAGMLASRLKQEYDAMRLERDVARQEGEALRLSIAEIEKQNHFSRIGGRESPASRRMLHMMLKAGRTDATLLILGPTGSGKTETARAVHSLKDTRNSRLGRPFVIVDLAAVPHHLLEGDLFGTMKGGFTDAATKPGMLEEADGGTLFFDEIGELPLEAQKKLLRVIETGEARRVGGTKDYKVNVRFILATNRDLEAMVKKGEFREDLYYRVSRFTIRIPPLRDRPEDLPLLIARLFADQKKKHVRPELELSAAATRKLIAYHWPGNVRQLGGVLESLVLGADNRVIDVADLPREALEPAGPRETPLPVGELGLTEATGEFQREMIRRAVKQCGGDMTKAAALLRLCDRTYLYQLCRRLGLDTKKLKADAKGTESERIDVREAVASL